MKKLLNSYGARVLAFLLCCVFAMGTLVCALSYAYVAFEPGMGADDGRDFYSSELARSYVDGQIWNAIYSVDYALQAKPEDAHPIAWSDEGFSCVIRRADGTVVADNRREGSRQIAGDYAWDERYTADCYVNLPAERSWELYGYVTLYDFLYNGRTMFLPVGLGAALLTLLLFVFLMAAAGCTEEGVKLGGFHRWPLELYLLLLGCAAAGCAAIMVSIQLRDVMRHLAFFVSVYGLLILAAGICALLACMTLAARFRAGKWWRNTITFFCLRWGWRLVKWSFKLLHRFGRWCLRSLRSLLHGGGRLIRALPLSWKGVLVYGAFVLLNIFLTLGMTSMRGGVYSFFLLLMDAAGLFAVIWVTLQLKRLQDAGRALAAGDLNIAVDTRHMLPTLKEHAENLGAVSFGMTRAVNERMKSERFKTELITNVSHNLKTPLTSIVSYVDLLKKEPIENEKAREYIEVLDRQSQRLKKLTTDLVDASKASSGVLNVSREPVDLSELVRQSAGEYAERFALAELTPILSLPESAVVTADGRLFWRVLDNLLTNVVKYALSGTRVYLDVIAQEKATTISIKNISREALNIPAEELMERFVRGDESRHTEGSGLGLSIARSLIELMGGEFRLTLDGDLFKAEIVFPE